MFVLDEFGNLVFVQRNICFAEAEGAAEGAGGGSEGDGEASAEGAGEGEGDAGAAEAKAKEGADGGSEGDGGADEGKTDEADWRAALPDDLKKHADQFNSPEDLVKGHRNLRQQLSKAIVPPGKDAGEDEVAAYRKAIGVPADPGGYKFKMPEGVDASENDKAFHAEMAKVFHGLNISKDQAKGLNEAFNTLSTAAQEAQIEADKEYAAQSETELKKSWGKDYDVNKAHAERAAAQMFGDDFEEIRAMELRTGRFVMDHPVMLKALATIGREMAEGGLVPPLSDDAAEQANDEIRDIREKIAKAQAAGDNKRANELFQREQALIAKVQGNKSIVGAGRAA
ncbi:hypothetical protein [Roseibium sp.]|uniref:hypothetical protein n=1 Tax=Roseibium sp. TaxID=1936156 RepID=UPI003D0B2B46